MIKNTFSETLKESIDHGRRVNSNIFKVKDENSNVKSLLSMAVYASKLDYQTSMYKQVSYDIAFRSRRTKRSDLIRTTILLATSRNTSAKMILIDVLNSRIGKIKEKEYIAIAKILRKKDNCLADYINDFLCLHLNGYNEFHNKYYNDLYGF